MKYEKYFSFQTYAVDRMTPDSASTATAMLCGSKTNFLVLGLDGNAVYDNCTGSYNAERLDSIIHWAQAAGKYEQWEIWLHLKTPTMLCFMENLWIIEAEIVAVCLAFGSKRTCYPSSFMLSCKHSRTISNILTAYTSIFNIFNEMLF